LYRVVLGQGLKDGAVGLFYEFSANNTQVTCENVFVSLLFIHMRELNTPDCIYLKSTGYCCVQ